jgi:ABC-type branched-subunit amino acid transport system ATPase component
MTPLIQVRGLQKIYRATDAESAECEVRALNGIDLEIQAGEYIAIMGPSGSGKSTLMQILGLLDRPTHGEFFFSGMNVSALADEDLAKTRSRSIGFDVWTMSRCRSCTRRVTRQRREQRTCCVRSAWAIVSIIGRTSFRVDSNSGWRSLERWLINRKLSSPMNQREISAPRRPLRF